MNRMRKGISLLAAACLATACITAGGVLSAGASAAEVEVGTVFKLKDLTDKVNAALNWKPGDSWETEKDIGVMDSVWQPEWKEGGQWKTLTRASYADNKVYIHHYQNSAANGVSYYTQETSNLYCLTPNPGIDVAWTFRAPATGTYSFAPDTAGDTFKMHWPKPDYSNKVRIVANGVTIWPEDASGWAVIDETTTAPVPSLPDIALIKGQILRVEVQSKTAAATNSVDASLFGSAKMTYTAKPPEDNEKPAFPKDAAITAANLSNTGMKLAWPPATDNLTAANSLQYEVFTGKTTFTAIPEGKGLAAEDKVGITLGSLEADTDYYAAVVVSDMAGNQTMLTGGPFKTTNVKAYSLYDYARDMREALEPVSGKWDQELTKQSESPWVSYVKRRDQDKWIPSTIGAYKIDGHYIMLYGGVSTPGAWVLAEDAASQEYILNPCLRDAQSKNLDDGEAAWGFTAPKHGFYTFSAPSDALKNSQFKLVYAESEAKIGVRITINDVKIWPKDKEYAEVSKDTPADIPTITEIEMKKGQLLKLETKVLEQNTDPAHTRLYAAGYMVLDVEVPPDTAAPVFPADAAVSVDGKTDSQLAIQWPAATDDRSAADKLAYTVYYDTDPLEGTPTTGGKAAPNKTSVVLTNLDADTDYYVCIVAQDEEGNAGVLKAGPFRTDAGEQGDESGGLPDKPLEVNTAADAAGIVSHEGHSVTVGWMSQAGIETYRLLAFVKAGEEYSLAAYSEDMDYMATSCTLSDLEAGSYGFQVVGYNMQGDVIAAYPVLELDLSGGGGNGGGGHGGQVSPPTGVALSLAALAVGGLSAGAILYSRKKRSKNGH